MLSTLLKITTPNKAIGWTAIVLGLLCGPVTAQTATRVEVPIFEGGAGLDFFFFAAREYEKVRPDVQVDLYGDPRIADKVRVRILEGTFPEASNAGLNYWALIRNGEILPLDDYLDGPSWDGDRTWRASFLPGSLDRYEYEGKIYGIPFLYSVYAVWYNKNMFEEHGWAPPRTWDEFFALCEQIRAAGVWPLAFQGRYPGYIGGVTDNAYYHLAGRAIASTSRRSWCRAVSPTPNTLRRSGLFSARRRSTSSPVLSA